MVSSPYAECDDQCHLPRHEGHPGHWATSLTARPSADPVVIPESSGSGIPAAGHAAASSRP